MQITENPQLSHIISIDLRKKKKSQFGIQFYLFFFLVHNYWRLVIVGAIEGLRKNTDRMKLEQISSEVVEEIEE